MKSLMLFLRSVYTDCGDWCGVSTQLDLKTVELRIKHEGLSFLTITLPNFGKEFEKALDQGFVDPSMFASFSKRRSLPRFLGGFLGLVFEAGTGRLLTEPSISAIRSVRQITLLHGKMHVLCSKERERAALASYVNLDQKVRIKDANIRDVVARGLFFLEEGPRNNVHQRSDDTDSGYSENAIYSSFIVASKLLWGRVLSNASASLHRDGLSPQHGPGSTADGLKGNLKYRQRIWTDRLEAFFPFGNYAFPNWRSFIERSDLTWLDPGNEIPVKVISVPKTMKTPRLIAIEPTCMQYVQQGFRKLFVESVSQDKYLWRMINFDDQTPNQEFARKGSISGDYATLDLSEASDRVNMWHVEQLFGVNRILLDALLSCRSSKASIEGHGILDMARFASMGSAVCFPVEAMVFLTAVFAGISLSLNRPLNREDIKSFSTQVRVYGDDIIVPNRFTQSVVETLTLLGFKVNSNKSFWTGKYRESCGKEYYAGSDVSIVKARYPLPAQRKDTQEIISAVSTRNQFFMAGFVNTTEFFDNLIERFIPFPEVGENSPILGKLTHGPIGCEGMNPNTHTPFVTGCVVVPRKRRREIDGYDALMKWFLKDNELPFVDRDHLVYSGRPTALTLKVRRRSPL